VIGPIENLSLTNPREDLIKSLIKKIPLKKDLIKKDFTGTWTLYIIEKRK
jgi:hypothetical protein